MGPLEKDPGIGFEGFDASRTRRLSACMRRAVRGMPAAGWAVGVFDANQDLVTFTTSGPELGTRTALGLLCVVPFPASPNPVALNVSAQQREELPPAVGISVSVGPRHSAALVIVLQRHSEEIWSQVGETIRSAIGEIAGLLADSYFDSQSAPAPAAPSGPHAFFMLNTAYEVELAWYDNSDASSVITELIRPENDRLPLFLEQVVRRLTSSWNFSRPGTCVGRRAYPLRGLALRVVPMIRTDVRIGAFLDRYDVSQEGYSAVSATFRISAREREVLHALLDGASIAEIADGLNLAESTVNDHVARMIAKTNARNRIQMAATLLGWPGMHRQPAQSAAGVDLSSEAGGSEAGVGDVHGGDGQRAARPSWRFHIGATAPHRQER